MVKGFKPINTCKWENGRLELPKQEELMCWRASVATWFSFSWWANNDRKQMIIDASIQLPKQSPKKLWECTSKALRRSIWEHISISPADLKVKQFTRPNFRAKEFYTLKTRKWRLFLLAINSENALLSVIWPSFG